MLITFDSLPEFIQRIKKENLFPTHKAEEWTGYVSFDDAIEKTLHGDNSFVAEAEKLIEQLSVAMPTTRMFKTITSPYGGRCHFADWQVGSPTPMRRRIRTSTDFGPLKIVVSTTCSCGIHADTMARRGAAILALLLKLQEIRPIELYLLAETHGSTTGWLYQQIKIDTKPLDISIAAFVLCHVSFARHLTYRLADRLDGFNGQWPRGYSATDYSTKRRERLNLLDDDIMISEVHMDDKLVQRPLEWLEDQLGKYREQ